LRVLHKPTLRAGGRAFLSLLLLFVPCTYTGKSACEPAWNKSRRFSLLHSLATITLTHVPLVETNSNSAHGLRPEQRECHNGIICTSECQCECIIVVVIMHFKADAFAFFICKSVAIPALCATNSLIKS